MYHTDEVLTNHAARLLDDTTLYNITLYRGGPRGRTPRMRGVDGDGNERDEPLAIIADRVIEHVLILELLNGEGDSSKTGVDSGDENP